MKLLVSILFALIFSSTFSVVYAQQEKEVYVDLQNPSDTLFKYAEVEIKPTFQGGDLHTFKKWVQERIEYPKIYSESSVKGRVFLRFTIFSNGEVGNIKVVESLDKYFEVEAIRVVSSSPKWTPGERNGRKVAVSLVFPVAFILD